MQQKTFEIEVKSLIQSKDKISQLREELKTRDPELTSLGKHSQLNHYFTKGRLEEVIEKIVPHLDKSRVEELKDIVRGAKDYSLRTRDADGKVYFILKVSIDDTTSANGIKRQEFEAAISLTLDELDALILSAGFEYEAKWSRDREAYRFRDMEITIDRNAGYGYVVEIERLVSEESEAEKAREIIYKTLEELGLEELKQDRLARMFDYYNHNWREYYGTDKIFVIE